MSEYSYARHKRMMERLMLETLNRSRIREQNAYVLKVEANLEWMCSFSRHLTYRIDIRYMKHVLRAYEFITSSLKYANFWLVLV